MKEDSKCSAGGSDEDPGSERKPGTNASNEFRQMRVTTPEKESSSLEQTKLANTTRRLERNLRQHGLRPCNSEPDNLNKSVENCLYKTFGGSTKPRTKSLGDISGSELDNVDVRGWRSYTTFGSSKDENDTSKNRDDDQDLNTGEVVKEVNDTDADTLGLIDKIGCLMNKQIDLEGVVADTNINSGSLETPDRIKRLLSPDENTSLGKMKKFIKIAGDGRDNSEVLWTGNTSLRKEVGIKTVDLNETKIMERNIITPRRRLNTVSEVNTLTSPRNQDLITSRQRSVSTSLVGGKGSKRTLRKKRTLNRKEKDDTTKQTLISSFMCPPEKQQDQEDEQKDVSK